MNLYAVKYRRGEGARQVQVVEYVVAASMARSVTTWAGEDRTEADVDEVLMLATDVKVQTD